jgi:aquaporin Z
VFAGGEYLGQLWLLWIVPLLGAAAAGMLSCWMYDSEPLIDTIVVEVHKKDDEFVSWCFRDAFGK